MKLFDTPILYLIFNRPDLCETTFERIREIKPKYLFIAADGPREDVPGEQETCEKTRKLVLNNIDWDCEVKTLFREENLGCKYAVSSAIDWFFENVEMGIILEDDCLANKDFFEFCEFCLDKYRSEGRVMHISGDKFSDVEIKESLFYSKYIHIWGWATWRRAWRKYDSNIRTFPVEGKQVIKKIFPDTIKQRIYWDKIFKGVYSGETNTWDYQWTYSCWKNNGVSVNPAVNLISNIGFGESATHLAKVNQFSNLSTSDLKEPYIIPAEIKINKKNDKVIAASFFRNQNTFLRIKKKLQHLSIQKIKY